MLRESEPQATLWDALLPEEAKRLPAELVAVDGYLDDEIGRASCRERV